MKGNIKALLDLHICVRVSNIQETSTIPCKKTNKQPTYPYIQTKPKRQCGDLTPGGAVG